MLNKLITRKNGVDTVVLDVSGTTATEEKVLKGEIFTKADGTSSVGTYEPEEGLAEATTESEMSALTTEKEVGYVARYSGETTENYENGRLYVLVEENTITFKLGVNEASTSEYEAESGMTWTEWVNSDYQPGHYTIESNGYVKGNSYYVADANYNACLSTDVIEADYVYMLALQSELN